MNSNQDLPFNIDVLTVREETIRAIKPVTSLQIFDNNNNFHPEGLFSIPIFGAVGSEYRSRMFGYIPLKTDYMHPLVYYTIVKLKQFYGRIIAGKESAVWNAKTKEFDKSTGDGSRTGFTFFMEHLNELSFKETGSMKRSFLIKLFNKALHENKHTIRHLLVLPAGLRDYFVDSSGKPQEDEINSFYRKIMFQTNLVNESIVKLNKDTYDEIFLSVQKTIFELYEYLKSLLEGKHKLILGKWLTRKIFNSTRNVLTSYVEKVDEYDSPNRMSYNDTVVGLHQFLKVAMPRTLFEIKNNYIRDIFIENSSFCYLTNKKTLKKEEVYSLKIQKDIEAWTSMEGIEKIVANFSNLNIRHDYITLNNGEHYIGLLYKDDKYYKFISDIDEVPDGFSRDNVKPITMAEFLYISVAKLNGKIPGFDTRYPVIEFGSIYPTIIKIKTTSNDLVLEELDDNWQPSGFIATSFPIRDVDFFNTMAAHSSHWGKMGADSDGDVLSLTAVLSDEGMEEIFKLLNSREYYFDSKNKFNFTLSIDTTDGVLAYMTRQPK